MLSGDVLIYGKLVLMTSLLSVTLGFFLEIRWNFLKSFPNSGFI